MKRFPEKLYGVAQYAPGLDDWGLLKMGGQDFSSGMVNAYFTSSKATARYYADRCKYWTSSPDYVKIIEYNFNGTQDWPISLFEDA